MATESATYTARQVRSALFEVEDQERPMTVDELALILEAWAAYRKLFVDSNGVSPETRDAIHESFAHFKAVAR